MLLVAYVLAQTTHGPWDNWMWLFFLLAAADLLVLVAELGLRVVQTLYSYISLGE